MLLYDGSCCFYQTISVTVEEQWPTTLADYIRHNDETLLKCSERLMATYTEELLPATSFEEMCDILGLCFVLNIARG